MIHIVVGSECLFNEDLHCLVQMLSQVLLEVVSRSVYQININVIAIKLRAFPFYLPCSGISESGQVLRVREGDSFELCPLHDDLSQIGGDLSRTSSPDESVEVVWSFDRSPNCFTFLSRLNCYLSIGSARSFLPGVL